MKKTLFLCLSLLLLTVGFYLAAPPTPPGGGGPDMKPALDQMPVSGTIAVSKTEGNICVGDEITVSVTIKPQAGWHLYSTKPSPEGAYKPTEFYLEIENSVKKVGVAWENKKPHEEDDPIMGGIVRHFDNEQTIVYSQRFKILTEAVKFKGGVTMQICRAPEDGGMCVPAEWNFSWEFKANPPGTPACDAAQNAAVVPVSVDTSDTTGPVPPPQPPANKGFTGGGGENPSSGTGPGVDKADDCSFNSILLTFLIAFGAGLLAIFTPCVFPMIPLTVSFFVKQSKTRSEGIRNALFYAGSIIFIYTVIGFIVTVAFGETFLYEVSSSATANVIFFIILFVFALSFLGWFDIALPASWSNKLDEKADRGGMIGIFFMALVLVIVSFSCTGPIIGSLLVSATSSGACFWTPIAGMFGFGLAFAIPFGFFAFFPGLMSGLTKQSGWLNVIKVTLGFIELAFCMKFLSNADLAMHWHILDRHVFIGIWIVLFGLLGMYLLGKFHLPHDEPTQKISVPRLLFAIMSLSFAAYLVPGLWGAKLDTLEGLVPPMHKDMGVRLLPGQVAAGGDGHGAAADDLNGKICSYPNRLYEDILSDRETHGFCVFYDYEQAKAFAKEHKRPLFVDFTGHTCANCRKMEQSIWVDDKVHQLLREEYVMVSLYVDEPKALDKPYTTPAGKEIKTVGKQFLDLESTKYKAIAQPLYALEDFEGNTLVPPSGSNFDAAAYAQFLQSGLDAFKAKHGEAGH